MASNVPPTPATEEAIVDCAAFFYEEGKGGENFRKKNKSRSEKVLYAVFGFGRIFFILFFGFAVSNVPQCPPPKLLFFIVKYANL